MQLGITLGQRISQAERLPKKGNQEYMEKVAKIRQALIGFADAQLTSWRIVPYNDTFITAFPDQGTLVTLSDDLVKMYASYIKGKSNRNEVLRDEAELFAKILEEDARINEESQE